MPPAPDGAVGLRHWTVLLDLEDLEAVKRRLAHAGGEVEPSADGVLARDPFGNSALFGLRGR